MVSRSKQLMHLEEERTDQQAWPFASFCFLAHKSILFFPLSFLKFWNTGTEGKPEFSCGPGLIKLLSCAGSVGHVVLYSLSLQAASWPCTATLLLFTRRCERTRENPPTDRESKPTAPLERGSFAERLKGGFLCHLVLPHRQQITVDVSCGTPYAREDLQEVHHCCSPTAELPFEQLTAKQRMKTQLKMKWANYEQ